MTPNQQDTNHSIATSTTPKLGSPAQAFGELVATSLASDPRFYLFSPDETTSNRLDAAYNVSERAWSLPREQWDLPEATSGHIVELLSENVLFATMLGHIMSGEPGIMTSYEAFFNIITSQLVQHIKFLQQSSAVSWRMACPAINLLSTSTCWRQDHNGFSHQSPLLISTLLSLPSNRVNCLFPVDDTSAIATYHFMQHSKNVVNLTTFNKDPLPRWIDYDHAEFQLKNGGASIFAFASHATPEQVLATEPDFIFTAAGDIVTTEALAAMEILHQDMPSLKIRFVGLTALSYNAIGTTNNPLPHTTFEQYFPAGKPIIANFHGYPATLAQILSRYTHPSRILVHGFSDHGTTTTPFEMLSLNQASRYHLCLDVAHRLKRADLVDKYRNIITRNSAHAKSTSLDLPECTFVPHF